MTAPAEVFVEAARRLWGEAWCGAAARALRVNPRRMQRVHGAVCDGDQLATVPAGWITETVVMMRDHAAMLMQLADSLARTQVNVRSPVASSPPPPAPPSPIPPSTPAGMAKEGGAPMDRARGRI
jgi:hypothetical protein